MKHKKPTKGAGGQKGFWSKKKAKPKKKKSNTSSGGAWSRKMK